MNLGIRGRVVFCALFFGSEGVLIATAGMRSDRSYGFRMFPESSSIVAHMSRRLADGQLVPIDSAEKKGRWQAHDCGGAVHTFSWGKMVRFPAPARLDTFVGAPYGVENEIQRTRDAMQWVADHTPDDCETKALVATIEARKNGRPPYPVTLEVERGH
jgi:hypothetical protein